MLTSGWAVERVHHLMAVATAVLQQRLGHWIEAESRVLEVHGRAAGGGDIVLVANADHVEADGLPEVIVLLVAAAVPAK